jgi:DNA gyrase subunit A
MPGPDFPTGGLILGHAGIRSAYHTGRGSILMRGRVAVEEIRREREAIVITEIPYQVNKATMVERIAEAVRDKRIEGISDIRDESDRHGMRVVVELKRDAVAEVVLNQLYRYSQLQSTFGINAVALTGGRPEVMTLHDLISAFIAFREEVVTKRTKFLLNKARDRAHVLVGMAIAVANISEVIRLIRAAPDPATARAELMGRDWPAHDMTALIVLIADPRHRLNEDGSYRLSEEQARAILDLRLQRLTALGRDEIGSELEKLGGEIEDYLSILRSRARVQSIIKDELTQIKTDFATPRRTEIVEQEGEFEAEDLIQREDMVVTVTHAGYIKRVPLTTYRAQRRGGKGRAGMAMRDADFVSKLFVANTHTPILFFSSRGMAYKMKVWKLPLSAPQARGKALVNLLPLAEGERITTIMPLPEDETQWEALDVMFATTRGTVRRNKLSDFVSVRQNGKIAMKLDEGEGIVGVETCSEDEDVLLSTATASASASASPTCACSRAATPWACAASRWARDDTVISLSILRHLQADSPERQAYLRMRRAMAGEEAEPNGETDEENGNGERRPVPGALHRDERGGTVRAVDLGQRLRQAHVVLRIPGHGPRRQGHRRHDGERAQRPARRLLPRRAHRPDHAGDRPRPAHPHPRRRHPHRRPLDARRDPVPRRRRRNRRLRRPPHRRRSRRDGREWRGERRRQRKRRRRFRSGKRRRTLG